jgi:hypothetical protein
MKPLLRNQLALAGTFMAGALIALMLGCSSDDKPAMPKGAQPKSQKAQANAVDSSPTDNSSTTVNSEQPAAEPAVDTGEDATDRRRTRRTPISPFRTNPPPTPRRRLTRSLPS